MGNKKVRKWIIGGTLGLGLGVVALTKCSAQEDLPFETVLESAQDNTILDEYLKLKSPDLLDSVSLLEKYIDLSEKLNKKKIEKMYITKEQLAEATLLEPNEVEDLLNSYSKDKKNEELLFKINVQIKLVNKFIIEEGYGISSELSLLTLKAKVAESYRLPTDLTIQIMDLIKVPSQEDYNNFKSITINDEEIVLWWDYMKLIKDIYELQHNIGKTDDQYNKDRNEMILNSINSAEKKLTKSYNPKFK